MSAMKNWILTHCIECSEEISDDEYNPDSLIQHCSSRECFDKYLEKHPSLTQSQMDSMSEAELDCHLAF